MASNRKPRAIRHVTELASIFEKSTQTIQAWLKEGMPGEDETGAFNLPKCAEWVRVNKTKSVPAEDENSTEAGLKRRKLRAQCEKIEFENSTETGKYILRDDAVRETQQCGHAIKRVLLGIPNGIAAVLGAEAEKIAKDKVTDALKLLSENPLNE